MPSIATDAPVNPLITEPCSLQYNYTQNAFEPTLWVPEFSTTAGDLGSINFDFGFDMSAVDFETFMNSETPP